MEVHLFEAGYTSNTRLDDLFVEKSKQHAELARALMEAGWTVVFPKDHIIALGTAAYVRKETEMLLEKWLPHDPRLVQSTIRKLCEHSAVKCRDHIRTRRILESSDAATGARRAWKGKG